MNSLALNIRPSSLPALAACPCFESSGDPSAFALAGNNRHRLAAEFLKIGESALENTDEEEAEKVRWSCKYLLDHAPMSEFPLRIEERRVLLNEDFEQVMAGTPDVTCGRKGFDFKSRPRGYAEQMAAYALMMFQDLGDGGTVEFHLLFCELQSERVLTFTKMEATAIVHDVLTAANAPDRKPVPCEYCGWCAKNLTCPALMRPALEIAKARGADENDTKVFESFITGGAHPSNIVDPGVMGVILRIMRCVGKAVDSAEHHAKEMAFKQGMVPEGFKVQSRAGKTFVSDVVQAFGLTALPQDEFMRACQLRLNSSKKYPDQIGIVDIYKKFHGIAKTTQAKKSLMEKLSPVVRQAQPSMSLVSVKRGGAETQEEEE